MVCSGLSDQPNQAFNADSLQRGILLRKILRPAANHSAGKPAPLCRLTWRYAASLSKDSANLKVAGVPHEFFEVRGVSVPVEPNLLVLRQRAREVGE